MSLNTGSQQHFRIKSLELNPGHIYCSVLFNTNYSEADLSLQLLESQQRKAASKLTVTVLSQQLSPENQKYTYSLPILLKIF